MSWFGFGRNKNADQQQVDGFGGFGDVDQLDGRPAFDPRVSVDNVDKSFPTSDSNSSSDDEDISDSGGFDDLSMGDESTMGGDQSLFHESDYSYGSDEDDDITLDTNDPDNEEWAQRKASSLFADVFGSTTEVNEQGQLHETTGHESASNEQSELNETQDENDSLDESSSHASLDDCIKGAVDSNRNEDSKQVDNTRRGESRDHVDMVADDAWSIGGSSSSSNGRIEKTATKAKTFGTHEASNRVGHLTKGIDDRAVIKDDGGARLLTEHPSTAGNFARGEGKSSSTACNDKMFSKQPLDPVQADSSVGSLLSPLNQNKNNESREEDGELTTEIDGSSRINAKSNPPAKTDPGTKRKGWWNMLQTERIQDDDSDGESQLSSSSGHESSAGDAHSETKLSNNVNRPQDRSSSLLSDVDERSQTNESTMDSELENADYNVCPSTATHQQYPGTSKNGEDLLEQDNTATSGHQSKGRHQDLQQDSSSSSEGQHRHLSSFGASNLPSNEHDSSEDSSSSSSLPSAAEPGIPKQKRPTLTVELDGYDRNSGEDSSSNSRLPTAGIPQQKRPTLADDLDYCDADSGDDSSSNSSLPAANDHSISREKADELDEDFDEDSREGSTYSSSLPTDHHIPWKKRTTLADELDEDFDGDSQEGSTNSSSLPTDHDIPQKKRPTLADALDEEFNSDSSEDSDSSFGQPNVGDSAIPKEKRRMQSSGMETELSVVESIATNLKTQHRRGIAEKQSNEDRRYSSDDSSSNSAPFNSNRDDHIEKAPVNLKPKNRRPTLADELEEEIYEKPATTSNVARNQKSATKSFFQDEDSEESSNYSGNNLHLARDLLETDVVNTSQVGSGFGGTGFSDTIGDSDANQLVSGVVSHGQTDTGFSPIELSQRTLKDEMESFDASPGLPVDTKNTRRGLQSDSYMGVDGQESLGNAASHRSVDSEASSCSSSYSRQSKAQAPRNDDGLLSTNGPEKNDFHNSFASADDDSSSSEDDSFSDSSESENGDYSKVVVREAPLLRLENCTSMTRSAIAETKMRKKQNAKSWGWFGLRGKKEEPNSAQVDATPANPEPSMRDNGDQQAKSINPSSESPEDPSVSSQKEKTKQLTRSQSKLSVSSEATKSSGETVIKADLQEGEAEDDPTSRFFKSQATATGAYHVDKSPWKDEESVASSRFSASKSLSNGTASSRSTSTKTSDGRRSKSGTSTASIKSVKSLTSNDVQDSSSDKEELVLPAEDTKLEKKKKKREKKEKKKSRRGGSLNDHFGKARKVSRHGDEVSVGTMNVKKSAHQHIVLSNATFDDDESVTQRPWRKAMSQKKRSSKQTDLGATTTIEEGDEETEPSESESIQGLLATESETNAGLLGIDDKVDGSDSEASISIQKETKTESHEQVEMDILNEMVSLSVIENTMLGDEETKKVDFDDMWDEVSVDMSTALEFERKKQEKQRRDFKRAVRRQKKQEAAKSATKETRLQLFAINQKTSSRKTKKSKFSNEFLDAIHRVFDEDESSQGSLSSKGSILDLDTGDIDILQKESSLGSNDDDFVSTSSSKSPGEDSTRGVNQSVLRSGASYGSSRLDQSTRRSNRSQRSLARESSFRTRKSLKSSQSRSSRKLWSTKSSVNPAEVFEEELKRQKEHKVLSISNLRQEMFDRRGISIDYLHDEYEQHLDEQEARRLSEIENEEISEEEFQPEPVGVVNRGPPLTKVHRGRRGSLGTQAHSRWDSNESVSDLDDLKTVMDVEENSSPQAKLVETLSGMTQNVAVKALDLKNETVEQADTIVRGTVEAARFTRHAATGIASGAVQSARNGTSDIVDTFTAPKELTMEDVQDLSFRPTFDDMPLTTIGEVEDYDDENEQGLLGGSTGNKWDEGSIGTKSRSSASRSSLSSGRFSFKAKLPKVDMKIPGGLKKMKSILPRKSKDRSGANGFALGDDEHGLLG